MCIVVIQLNYVNRGAKMLKSWKSVGKGRRVLNLTALALVLIGGPWVVMTWNNRQAVASQVREPVFQNTHFGSEFGSYCGEVSGINGFGMRSPYFRFVVVHGVVHVFPLTTDRIKVNDFENLWAAQCEPDRRY